MNLVEHPISSISDISGGVFFINFLKKLYSDLNMSEDKNWENLPAQNIVSQYLESEPGGSCDSRFTLESSQSQKLQDEAERLAALVDTLHEKLKTKKNLVREEKQKNHILEYNLRNQLTSEFEKILNDTESHYQKQLESMMKSKEKTFEKIFEVIRNHGLRVEIKKRKRDSEGSCTTCTEDTVVSEKMQALQDEIEPLKETLKIQNEDAQEELKFNQQKITGLTVLLETSKQEKSELSLQINELKFQNGLLQDENKKLQRTAEAVKSDNTQALLDQIEQLKEIIKDRDELLEEAHHYLEHVIKEKEQAKSKMMSVKTQLAEKDYAIDKLNADLDSMKHLLSTQIEKNEERLDKYNEMEKLRKKLQNEVDDFKKTLAERTDQLKSAKAKIEQQEEKKNCSPCNTCNQENKSV